MMKKTLIIAGLLLANLISFSQSELLLISQTFDLMEMHDGETLFTFGYVDDYGNDMFVPGPILYMTEGDSVILDMHNLSAIPHTVHLHGLDVNQDNDGVPQTSFMIPQNEHGYYHLTAPHAGTYIYHCHYVSSIHVQAGMYGFVIVLPESGEGTTWDGGYEYDHDFPFMSFEFDSDWHSFDILNQMMGDDVVLPLYDPEYFMINGYSEQQLEENAVGVSMETGETAHLRFANMGFYANRVLFPEGDDYLVVASDGRPIPVPFSGDSLWVMPGERYDVIYTTDEVTEESIFVEFINMNTGITEDTQELAVQVDQPDDVQELQLGYVVYPNPVEDNLTVVFEQPLKEATTMKIYDVEGRICFVKTLQPSTSRFTLQVNDLEAGVFLLEMADSINSGSKRIVVK
jgi:plastocyanin